MDASPAVLTVVLQAGDVGAEEGRKLAPTARPLAFIAHLVVQDVGLHLHLAGSEQPTDASNAERRMAAEVRNCEGEKRGKAGRGAFYFFLLVNHPHAGDGDGCRRNFLADNHSRPLMMR